MSTQTAQTLLTADQFRDLLNKSKDQELIEGEVHEMSKPGLRHGNLANMIAFFLTQFVMEHGGAKVLPECGFLLKRDPDTVRAPDVAVLTGQAIEDTDNPKFSQTPPAIAIEITSPNDTNTAVTDKAQWWLHHGVEQVWIIDDSTRTLTVHHPDGTAHVHDQTQTLDAGQTLPGFTLQLPDLFAA